MSNADDGARPFPNSYWVRPRQLLAGEYPGPMNADETRRRLRQLLEQGVTFFLDLTHEAELKSYALLLQDEAAALRRPAEYQRMPVQDLTVPAVDAMRRILDQLDVAFTAGHIVYVHCWAGIGRTGAVVGCHLARHGVAGSDALDRIRQLRRVMPLAYSSRMSPETEEQRQMVLNWPAGL
ncbi:MAG: dual specificity protein phosphatase family protein [Chloroflexi bacterium]|nr:dual specificity protein phosphatase family protein [Chloroflexota bacterium]